MCVRKSLLGFAMLSSSLFYHFTKVYCPLSGEQASRVNLKTLVFCLFSEKKSNNNIIRFCLPSSVELRSSFFEVPS